jgi:hypothetical protein
MKNYQFYTILAVIIIWFIILYIKIDNIDSRDYIRNIDQNVVNVDEYLHKKLDSIFNDEFYSKTILDELADIKEELKKDWN